MKPTVTADLSQSCLDLAVELTRGGEFFDQFGQPTEAVLRYTGDRVMQDQERCLMAGALRLLRCSDRQIAKAVGCDVRSIPLMLRAAEKSGRIPALKERLTHLTGDNAEAAQIALANLLGRASEGSGDIDLAAMIKAVATAGGIATQNLQLLTGGPTEILELKVGAGREAIEAWAREVAAPVDITPKDLQSVDNPSFSQQKHISDTTGDARDTSTPRPSPDRAAGAGGIPPTAGAGEGDRSGRF